MPSGVAEEYKHAAPHAMGLIPFRNYVRSKHIVFLVPICQKYRKANQVLQYTPRPLDKNTKDGANNRTSLFLEFSKTFHTIGSINK